MSHRAGRRSRRSAMSAAREATPGCENGPAFANARPYRLAVRRERPRRFVRRDRRRAYDPPELVELEPWSGGAGLAVDGAGLELGVGAGAGDTGFGAVWLAGAAGAAGRGAIGDAPTCVGAGDVCAEGGMAEAGRGGAGGGAKGFGAGAGDAAAGFGGGGAAGRGAGAGA